MERTHIRAVPGPGTAKPPDEVSSHHMQQPRCRLLELPTELRESIYSWVLASTRITYGETPETSQWIKPTINKSRSYPLALLRTCRQINEEIGSRWIGWALFNFESPESLLDTLTGLPTACVAALRHIRVSGHPVMLSLPHDDVYYRLAWTMKLVPHLQLDTLTVLGGSASSIAGGPAQVDYNTLEELIMYGTGWRELQYITPDSAMLSFPRTERFGQTYLRKPQPSAWRSALSQRDGPDSGSSVTIYRSRAIMERCQLAHREQDTFEQAVASEHLEGYALSEDTFLAASSEREKETLVVAKRGRNADIMSETLNPPYNQDYDIRALSSNMTWSQIRENFTEGGVDYDDETNFHDSTLHGTIITRDTYCCNAHEINWDTPRQVRRLQ